MIGKETTRNTAIALGILTLAPFAVSRKTRSMIHELDPGCTITGIEGHAYTNAMHLDHNKANPSYESPAILFSATYLAHAYQHLLTGYWGLENTTSLSLTNNFSAAKAQFALHLNLLRKDDRAYLDLFASDGWGKMDLPVNQKLSLLLLQCSWLDGLYSNGSNLLPRQLSTSTDPVIEHQARLKEVSQVFTAIADSDLAEAIMAKFFPPYTDFFNEAPYGHTNRGQNQAMFAQSGFVELPSQVDYDLLANRGHTNPNWDEIANLLALYREIRLSC